MNRYFRFLFLLLLINLCITGNVIAANGGTLRVALTTMPDSLDMPMASERQAQNASWQLYNSLVWMNEKGEVEPALATSWILSKDQATYTFKLRKGVTFHNGEAFTADSVVFSWNRAKQDKMKWSEKWTIAKSVKKIDDYTVEINTGDPSPLFIRVLADYWAIVPAKYITKVGEQGFANHPMGTGPFKFVKWSKGDRIIFEKNQNYWEKGLPKLDKLVFRPITESSTRVAAIKTGEIDIVSRLSAEEAATLKNRKNVIIKTYPIDRVFYITFNNLTSGKGKPTENKLVRQAMNYAVDVDAIITALFNGHARPSTGYVTPGNLGYDTTLKPFGYNPEKAKKLLAEAGYPKGFKIGFAAPSGAYTNFDQVCQAIQNYLKEVGIEAELQLMESGKYWNLEAKKELPPLFGDSWSEQAGEALPRLKGALGGMKSSYSSWSDPKIDDYLKKIGSTVDEGARAKLYVELQRYMHDDPPFIYLYEPETFEAVNPKVKNYTPRPAEQYYLKNVEIQ